MNILGRSSFRKVRNEKSTPCPVRERQLQKEDPPSRDENPKTRSSSEPCRRDSLEATEWLYDFRPGGDGTHVDRQIINLTDTTPFGTKTFKIPFDAPAKKWVRFAVWDSAGDGAWLQPIALK
jgi:hypothetical protein